MKAFARMPGLEQLHDQFFDRVVGRTVSAVSHGHDAPSQLHYHSLVFSKPGEPDASLPIVPVTALLQPHFALSHEQVMVLQRTIAESAGKLLEVFSSEQLAQLSYCLGSTPGSTPLGPSGSPSEGAALSGRAQRAVPPEASPEGRSFLAGQVERLRAIIDSDLKKDLRRIEALTLLESLARTRLPAQQTGKTNEPLVAGRLRVSVENRTGFVVDYAIAALGFAGAEPEQVIVELQNVEPEPGALWPE